MDVDDDNFYDEISSFIPSPDDYTFNDFDEILSSTVSNLDSAFDIDSLVKSEFGLSNLNEFQQEQNAFGNFNLSGLQSPSDASNAAISPYSAQRSSSTSSADGELFSSDDFIKFLNDDEMKLEEFSPLTNMDESLQQRNTPSPTGSCSSSGGSSTSGIQSDASSVIDSKPIFGQDIECGVIMQPASTIPTNPSVTTHFMHIDDVKTPKTIQTSLAAPLNSTFAPITTSVLPIAANPTITTDLCKSTALVRPIQQVTPINIVPGTIIPIQNVPLASVTAIPTPTTINTGTNIATTSLPIKIETKICPKSITTGTQPVKIVAAAPATTVNKVTPPANSKPKTIYLSANDFKALMQKVNTDGKNGTKTTTGAFNGQMPKIIMKAPNGKVITSKVATPVSLTNQTAMQPSPKIIKTTHGSLQSKQHAQKFISNSRAAAINILKLNAAGNSPTNSSTSSSSGSSSVTIPDLSIYKGIVDEKMLKKQQRMIKNRESASLSRKKKKEYVISLETRISNLEKENSSLKGENTSLRSQLVAFAQTCQCKNGNAGEFVLNSLDFKVNSEHQHVKIAPKPTTKSMRQKMTAANIRKNVALLFAMAFMVTMNVGNFQNYLNKNSLESAIVESGEELLATSAANGNPNALSSAAAAAGSTRRLLWVPTETEFNKQLNQTKRESEMDAPPPLHFLKPVNRTNGSRKFDEQVHTNAKADEPPLLATKCGTSKRNNQTEEYLRLATKLHKWIDGNDYLNLSMPYDKYNNDDDDYAMDTDMKKGNFKLPEDLFDAKPLIMSAEAKGKRKIYMDPETNYEPRKHRKVDLDYVDDNLVGDKKSLDLFKPKISEEYLRLFKGIKRQDDTFYVLSFNMDHILLPASAYNKSVRPKMSLMLPAGDPSLNGDIVLMQIDCEVINTTELALKSEMIPEKLRPQKYTGASAASTAAAPKPNDVANNETGSSSVNLLEKLNMKAANNLIPKEKPTVRTYVLVGPKTQEAAAAAKQQPTIVRISPNDSRFLNVKNSTLISKMRENYPEDIDDIVP